MDTSLVGSPLIPVDRVKLGRFITEIDDPTFYHHDPKYPEAIEPIVNVRQQYTGSMSGTQNAESLAKLSELLSSVFSKRSKKDLALSAKHVKTYTLDNTRAWFNAASKDPSTQQWLRNAIDSGDSIYYLCGFSTTTEAAVKQKSDTGKDRSVQAEIPLGSVMAAANMPFISGQFLDPSVKITRQRGNEISEEYEVCEEVVFAWRYRKVCHSFFSSKDVDNAALARKSCWRMTEAYQNQQNESDSIELDFVDDWQPEEGWVQEESIDGELLMVLKE